MNTANLFKAAKIIEEDGIDGIDTAIILVGRKTATTLLISHLRRNLGSIDTFPADPEIDEKVKAILRGNNLLQIDSFRGEYRFLSNFWLVNVEYEGVTYPSVEHAYQAAKSTNPKQREKIKKFIDPADAKKESDKMQIRPDWNNDMRINVMRQLLDQKFSVYKNPELAYMLEQTGDFELIEGNNWGDIFFGTHEGIGENHLGKLQMQKRLENRLVVIERLKSIFRDNSNLIKIVKYFDYQITESEVLKISQIFRIKIG
jgi:ribA/ribD-fused uncharacterized protein